MKKRISLLLVFMLLLGVVVACSPADDGDVSTPPVDGDTEDEEQ